MASGQVSYGFSALTDGNMKYTEGISKGLVTQNRLRFLAANSSEKYPLYTVNQVHGNAVHVAKKIPPEQTTNPVQADAIITQEKKMALGILTADCLPVIIYDNNGAGIGAIHAGRAGTALSITYKCICTFRDQFNVPASSIQVVMGPCIGRCCYEVEWKDVAPFKEITGNLSRFSDQRTEGKWNLDIAAINEMQALEAGVPPAQIIKAKACTLCSNNYFSYRRNHTQERSLNFAAH